MCNLADIQNPVTELVSETLQKKYGFDEKRINELKEKA